MNGHHKLLINRAFIVALSISQILELLGKKKSDNCCLFQVSRLNGLDRLTQGLEQLDPAEWWTAIRFKGVRWMPLVKFFLNIKNSRPAHVTTALIEAGWTSTVLKYPMASVLGRYRSEEFSSREAQCASVFF